MVQQMANEELRSSLTLACMGTRADILESRGTLAKVYTATDAFSGVLFRNRDQHRLVVL